MSAHDPFALAHAYGIDVVMRDFGAGAAGVLVAEYDPQGPRIAINTQALARGNGDACTLARLAVAHELYHHREHIGDIARLAPGKRREAAAHAFACDMVETDRTR